MGLVTEAFAWWTGTTWGTRWTIWRHGRRVGSDDLGNTYYVQKAGVGPLGVPRRWVVYKNLAEASKVPPEWHGWLHYTVDEPPAGANYTPRAWQKPHQMNATGTPHAYRPPGSILASGKRAPTTSDYVPWQPKG